MELPQQLLVDPNGPRSAIMYHGPHSIQLLGEREFSMGGFRFRGRYRRNRVPVFAAPGLEPGPGAQHVVSVGNGTSTAGDLGAETLHAKECWYAVFAGANDGDRAAVFKVMPFLRVHSVEGNVVTLNISGENQRSTVIKTHQFATHALARTECLIITETISNRSHNFSGRIADIRANSQTTITLDDPGALAPYDYLLPAPPGFTHYRYLASFYMDTAEVRNIADDGRTVRSRGIYLMDQDTDGDKSAGVTVTTGGYTSPLALGIIVDSYAALSTASTGQVAEYFAMDDAHDEQTGLYHKQSTGSESYVFPNVLIVFSFFPSFVFKTGGALQVARSNSRLKVTGWIEP